jgi:cardiolipin synthase A/B
LSAGHAILTKRDSRAAVLWVGVIWLAPILGALFYWMLGVNRIRRRASEIRGNREYFDSIPSAPPCAPDNVEKSLGVEGRHLGMLAALVSRVVSRPLLPGNKVEPLINGDNAYPAMLAAIDGARESVTLSTYIFDRDEAGRKFVDALGRAVARGVEVRVLIDDTGARYSFPRRILPWLREARVPMARFLPTVIPFRMMAVNMRNHRKILVVDGRVGFTGGMNIRVGHWLGKNPKKPVRDVHFQVEGPVVAEFQEVFAEDWVFATKELLRGERWFPKLECVGNGIARGIGDGPDEDLDKLHWTIMGALSCARKTVRVVTPYFLPDGPMISALNLAAMRGVEVDIIMPSANNLPYVKWASTAILWQMLERGCRFWLTPGPFDHSKLMVVDGHWSLVGSANWDPRSLRLNFEFNLECYGRDLAGRLEQLVADKMVGAQRIDLEQVDGRSLPIRLRDGIARLFMPFL